MGPCSICTYVVASQQLQVSALYQNPCTGDLSPRNAKKTVFIVSQGTNGRAQQFIKIASNPVSQRSERGSFPQVSLPLHSRSFGSIVSSLVEDVSQTVPARISSNPAAIRRRMRAHETCLNSPLGFDMTGFREAGRFDHG